MRLTALTTLAVLMTGAAMAAPVEVNGNFEISFLESEGTTSVDLQLGDMVNFSAFFDDAFITVNELLEATPRLDEDDMEQEVALLETFALPTIYNQTRDGAPVFSTVTETTRVSAANGLMPTTEEIAEVREALDMALPFLEDGVDAIEFRGDIIPEFLGNRDDITLPVSDFFFSASIIAFNDGDWFERAALLDQSVSEMLEDANLILSVDINEFGIDQVGGSESGLGRLVGENIVNTFPDLDEAGSEEDALLPTVVSEDGYEFTIPEEVITENQIFFIDPDIAVGYTYDVTGADFDAILAPSLGAVNDPDGYVLTINGTDYVIDPGETINLEVDLGLTGITEFTLSGIDEALMLDPLNPLAFALGVSLENITGTVVITQDPITVFVPDPNVVPLPAGMWLMLGGMGALFGLRRRVV